MKFLSKSQQLFFVDVNKLILKFIWKGTDSKIAYKKKKKRKETKTPKKEKKVGGITLSDMKNLYVAPEIQTVWSWQRDRHTENDGTQMRT